MSKSNPRIWPSKSPAISRYGVAVLAVAIAIVVAGLLTILLHTEPIASSMISAVMLLHVPTGVNRDSQRTPKERF